MFSTVIKSSGKEQKFDPKKLYASVYASMLAAQSSPEEAQHISSIVSGSIHDWIADKKHVTSHEIRLKSYALLREYNHLAAYLYKHHKTLS